MRGTVGLEEVVARVEALEVEVEVQGARLREVLGRLGEGARLEAGVSRSDEVRGGMFSGAGVRRLGERYGDLLRAEWWFTRGGVLLLLLGLAFLFKLSVDEGWITPGIRVMFGSLVGALLVGFGVRVQPRRVVVGQAMIGGGVAALYASGFAAYTLYSIVPALAAFSFMIGVTVVAFALAIRQDAASLAVVGAVGGLATPFLLYDGQGSTVWLVVYTCVVLGGAAAVYLYRGWRVLLAPAACGAWVSLFIAEESLWPSGERTGVRVSALLLGIACCWFVIWGVPVLRSLLLRLRRPASPMPFASVAGILLLTAAFVGLFGTVAEMSLRQTGMILLAVAAGCAVVTGLLFRSERLNLRDYRSIYVQVAGSVGLGTLALVLVLEPWTLVVALALEASALRLIARTREDKLARVAGHGIFTALGVWFLLEVALSNSFESGWPAPTTTLVAALVGIVAAFFVGMMGATNTKLFGGPTRLVYHLAAHVALLAWLLAAISPLSNGGGWATVAWGFYGAALLIVALRLDLAFAFKLAVATLVLVAGKLFVVDLFWVEAAYRILLFLGFGGLFLALGYYLRSFWKPRIASPEG
ncbi:MAG: DUF2339 domain-containing protein [Rubrobacter sp.]